MREVEVGSEKKKDGFVAKKACNKQKVVVQYMKCGRSNQQSWDCKALEKAETSIFHSNINQKTLQKKPKFDKRHLKITELSSEEDLGKV